MQTQKDEIREEILAVAEIEFLNKGFKGTSMRTIAKKANTTLGNIYNYFESKEAILEAVMGHVPEAIEEMMVKHEEMEVTEKISIQEMLSQIEEVGAEAFGFDILLSRPFVVLMEGCKGTKYETYSKQFYEIVAHHLGEHLGNGQELMGDVISHSFITALLFIGKSKVSLEEKKKTFLKYIEMIILGILASQMQGE